MKHFRVKMCLEASDTLSRREDEVLFICPQVLGEEREPGMQKPVFKVTKLGSVKQGLKPSPSPELSPLLEAAHPISAPGRTS